MFRLVFSDKTIKHKTDKLFLVFQKQSTNISTMANGSVYLGEVGGPIGVEGD